MTAKIAWDFVKGYARKNYIPIAIGFVVAFIFSFALGSKPSGVKASCSALAKENAELQLAVKNRAEVIANFRLSWPKPVPGSPCPPMPDFDFGCNGKSGGVGNGDLTSSGSSASNASVTAGVTTSKDWAISAGVGVKLDEAGSVKAGYADIELDYKDFRVSTGYDAEKSVYIGGRRVLKRW